jgi:hypothetical protein
MTVSEGEDLSDIPPTNPLLHALLHQVGQYEEAAQVRRSVRKRGIPRVG